jgi:hypothetical protein
MTFLRAIPRPAVPWRRRMFNEHDVKRERPVNDIQSHPQGEIRGLTKLVKITEDFRKYAAEEGINENIAIETGLREKAEEFQHSGAKICSQP